MHNTLWDHVTGLVKQVPSRIHTFRALVDEALARGKQCGASLLTFALRLDEAPAHWPPPEDLT
ncbi:hypothetical protein P775_22580 [Puniceibacterium antarcticum]|uniref:Uncharacterized protein n=1 Tax=Puniceibacterium antarcticum TaxID=1206336 RepID=A0A2G8R8N2_9RHOB|nr:hypothetical protein P775_22580 [Puniceibacterium antarcticum]